MEEVEDGLASTDGGIKVDDATIVLLLLEVVTEWGFGAVVVPIVFDVDDDNDDDDDDDNKEGTIVDERTFLLILS